MHVQSVFRCPRIQMLLILVLLLIRVAGLPISPLHLLRPLRLPSRKEALLIEKTASDRVSLAAAPSTMTALARERTVMAGRL